MYNDSGELNIGKILNYHDLEKCYRIDVVLTNKVTKKLYLIEIDGAYHKYGRMVKKTEKKENFIMNNIDQIFKEKYKDYDIQYFHLYPEDLYGSERKTDKEILEMLNL